MRIEHVGTTKNITDRVQTRGLAQGDVLIAEVTAVSGDTVELKSQEGASLTARLLADIGVKVGDLVETVVDEAAGGRYVLRIVDITRGGAQPAVPDAGVTGALAGADTQALLDTLSMLKMNPGADPQTAVFLSRHGLAGTAENLETLVQIAKGGEGAGKLLGEAVAGLRREGAPVTAAGTSPALTAEKALAAVFATAQPEGDTAPGVSEGLNAQAPATAQPEGDTAPGISEGFHAQAPATAQPKGDTAPGISEGFHAQAPATAQPEGDTAPSVSEGFHAQAPATAQPEGDTAPSVSEGFHAQVPATAQPGGNAAAGSPGILRAAHDTAAPVIRTAQTHTGQAGQANADTAAPAQAAAGRLAERLVSLFIRLDDTENLAARIKKGVSELPAQLKELKLFLNRSDTINKDLPMQKLEPVEKQLALLSQVKRFDCFHIPLLWRDGTPATAELYVYRYRNKKAARADGSDESIVILLGLDTRHLGRVETIVKADGRNLAIRLHTQDMRLADEMEIERLRQAVGGLSFDRVQVSVDALTARTTVLNAEERLMAQAEGGASGVDIRI